MKKKASTKEDLLNELKSKQRKINRLEKLILELKESQAEEINNRTKELIYRSETQLKRAELASKSGNWELHLDSKIIFSSKGAEKIYGVKKGPIDYEIIKNSTLPEYRKMLDDALNNLIKHKQPYNLEFKIKARDTGEVKDIHSIAQYDKRRKILFGVIQDITSRKQTENILRASEERYHSIFRNSLTAVLLTTLNGKILAANPEACRIFKRTEKELCSLRREDIIDMTDPRTSLAIEERERTGKYNGELTFVKKDGAKFTGLLVSNIFLDKENNEQISIAIYDISGQKQTEEEMHRLNRRLRAISNCNQTLLRAVDEQSLLNEICRITCDEAGYRMAWVGYVEHDKAKTVRPVAWAGYESGYLANAKISWAEDTERGMGPIGRAIRSGEITYVQDFNNDPQMAPWRESALKSGYRSIVALPLKDENANVFGALQIYSQEINVVTPDEIRLLDELASDLAFGLNTMRIRAEHKRMEAEVRESEERFRMLFENVLDGICLVLEDPDPFRRKIVECNERYALMAGRSREELLKLDSLEGLQVTLDDNANKNRLESLDSGKAFRGTFSWIRPDKKENVIEFVGRPVTWRGKKYTIGIDRDITDRIRMEAEVKESEEKFRLIFENAFDGISVFTNDKDPYERKLVDCNEKYAAMAGRSREELLKLGKLQSLMVPLDDGTNKKRLESIEKGIAFKGYSSWIRPDGKENVIEYVGVPVTWRGKAYTIGIDRDITERKRTENELRKLSRAVEQSPISVVITDTNGNIEYVNPKTTETSGYRLEEVVGKNPRIFSSREKPKSEYKVLWDTIKSGMEWRGELHNKKKNGELYWEYVLISPILNENGKVTHFIAVKEDITERKSILEDLIAAKEKAEQTEKLKSEFLSQVSHEIRTPLVTIVSYTNLIKENFSEGNIAILPDYLESLSNSGRRMQRTFDLIVNAAQVLTNNYEPKFINLNLTNDILLKVYYEFENTARQKALDFSLVDNSKDKNIFADEYSLSQLFLNLFDNAIKYTKEGYVKIEINQENKDIIVKVIDSGIGISEDFLPYIFEIFRQEDQGYSRRYEGNGLGLMLTKKYCEINSGEIFVESVKGKGSTFTIKFKLII
jgi:PAS domain S-box-containing protein